jgi:tRNA threonylcarbamoyladenosine biosynthesis protein TsaB
MSNPNAPAFHWLAIETSTDSLSLAVTRADQTWTYTGAGAAQSSPQALPQIQALMAQAGLQFSELNAVVFGRGPGAFTGLRTACSLAQGLAFGAGVSVLPLDTLLAVAEQARATLQATHLRVLAVLDARMDQVYSAAYEYLEGVWHEQQAPQVQSPQEVAAPSEWDQDCVAAGNAWEVYAGRWSSRLPVQRLAVWPTAEALTRLAPVAWQHGQAVPPEQALPLYIRDKVAQTTAERQQAKQGGA